MQLVTAAVKTSADHCLNQLQLAWLTLRINAQSLLSEALRLYSNPRYSTTLDAPESPLRGSHFVARNIPRPADGTCRRTRSHCLAATVARQKNIDIHACLFIFLAQCHLAKLPA